MFDRKISTFCDILLRLCVSTLPSYINDTNDFKKKIDVISDKGLPKDCKLVKMDVRFLYSNINQKEGVECCVDFYEQYHQGKQKQHPTNIRNNTPSVSFFRAMLTIVLTCNFLGFGKQLFL
jgi:hypothetical protein